MAHGVPRLPPRSSEGRQNLWRPEDCARLSGTTGPRTIMQKAEFVEELTNRAVENDLRPLGLVSQQENGKTRKESHRTQARDSQNGYPDVRAGCCSP